MTWEAIASWLQGPMDAKVWEALIPSRGYTAPLPRRSARTRASRRPGPGASTTTSIARTAVRPPWRGRMEVSDAGDRISRVRRQRRGPPRAVRPRTPFSPMMMRTHAAGPPLSADLDPPLYGLRVRRHARCLQEQNGRDTVEEMGDRGIRVHAQHHARSLHKQLVVVASDRAELGDRDVPLGAGWDGRSAEALSGRPQLRVQQPVRRYAGASAVDHVANHRTRVRASTRR